MRNFNEVSGDDKNRQEHKHRTMLESSKSSYLFEWMQTSNYFADCGYYSWMADCLSKYVQTPKLILDFGCGTGEGILALIKKFNCQIISLEENEKCIDMTAKRLMFEGYEVKCVKRMEVSCTENLSLTGLSPYSNHYQKGTLDRLKFSEKIVLIQSDFLDFENDNELLDIIKQIPFDVITCWLIGTHQYHYFNDNIMTISEEEGYNLADFAKKNAFYVKFASHKIACELGDLVLQNNGIVNCVERLGHNEYLKNKDKIDSNNNLMVANTASMSFEATEVRSYCPPSGGIHMTNGEKITNANEEKEFCSSFFRKGAKKE